MVVVCDWQCAFWFQRCLASTDTPSLTFCYILSLWHVLQSTLQRVSNRSNVADMSCQPFYNFIQKTYTWHVVGLFAALYALGGFPAMVWGGALRIAWVYHITWFVNSASHCWGYQSYKTGIALEILTFCSAVVCHDCIVCRTDDSMSVHVLLWQL